MPSLAPNMTRSRESWEWVELHALCMGWCIMFDVTLQKAECVEKEQEDKIEQLEKVVSTAVILFLNWLVFVILIQLKEALEKHQHQVPSTVHVSS